MASSISAGTTSSTALVATADTSGILALQSNNGVTGLTLNASQALGVGSTPSFGTSGQVLTSGGSTASPTWATPSAGKLLQVVQAVKTDSQSTTSTSYVDITGLSVTITPTSATSKILVMAKVNNISSSNGETTQINLLRGSTTVTSSTAGGNTDTVDAWASGGGGGMSADNRKINSCSIDFLDSPATTSATTYKMQMLTSGAATAAVNRWLVNNDVASVSSITVMEIAA